MPQMPAPGRRLSRRLSSRAGEITIEQELGMTLDEFACYADVVYDNKNIGAAIASGTYPVDGMIVAPAP